MLPDFERIVLRILYNYAGQRRRLPTIDELIIKTGHNKQRICEALLYLENDHYISWADKTDTSSILILEVWERQPVKPSDINQPSGQIRRKDVHQDMNYWTQY